MPNLANLLNEKLRTEPTIKSVLNGGKPEDIPAILNSAEEVIARAIRRNRAIRKHMPSKHRTKYG